MSAQWQNMGTFNGSVDMNVAIKYQPCVIVYEYESSFGADKQLALI